MLWSIVTLLCHVKQELILCCHLCFGASSLTSSNSSTSLSFDSNYCLILFFFEANYLFPDRVRVCIVCFAVSADFFPLINGTISSHVADNVRISYFHSRKRFHFAYMPDFPCLSFVDGYLVLFCGQCIMNSSVIDIGV